MQKFTARYGCWFWWARPLPVGSSAAGENWVSGCVTVTNGRAVLPPSAESAAPLAGVPLFLVESGSLSVHYEDSKGRVRLAMVGPGSAVGEGAFFSRQPRSANVNAAQPSKVWCMTAMRFTELSNRNPQIALEIAMALGGLVSRRLANKPRRVAVT
jgi:CRP-like cAMP-binding protein